MVIPDIEGLEKFERDGETLYRDNDGGVYRMMSGGFGIVTLAAKDREDFTDALELMRTRVDEIL